MPAEDLFRDCHAHICLPRIVYRVFILYCSSLFKIYTNSSQNITTSGTSTATTTTTVPTTTVTTVPVTTTTFEGKMPVASKPIAQMTSAERSAYVVELQTFLIQLLTQLLNLMKK